MWTTLRWSFGLDHLSSDYFLENGLTRTVWTELQNHEPNFSDCKVRKILRQIQWTFINKSLLERYCNSMFWVGSNKELEFFLTEILHFLMNNSYLNILLICVSLRYGSEFWLWQILNRKIFFSTLLLQTCYLLLTSQDGSTLKPDQIDTSLYSRKSPKLTHSSEIEKVEFSTVDFSNFESSEVKRTYKLLENLGIEMFQVGYLEVCKFPFEFVSIEHSWKKFWCWSNILKS